MRGAVCALLCVLAPLWADDGLAARYPKDKGIAKDGHVLLADAFEGSLDAWENRKGAVEIVDGGVAGKCVQVTATLGQDTGGHLYTRLKRPVDEVFARFYVKFPRKAGYVHHFVHLGGYEPSTPWPQGGAGTRPRGDERVTVGIEPFGHRGRAPPPGRWGFYAYWHEMKVSADGKYWGNGLQPRRDQPVPRGKWQCVEVRLKLNTPGKRDGELALWLDGKRVAHFKRGSKRTKWTGMGFRLDKRGEPFEGFSWRKSDKLKVNFFWLLHYVTEGALRRNGVEDPPRTNRVWFDQVVVATRYVGPLKR